MNRIVAVISLLVLGCPVITLAGPKEDVAAATQTWIAGMTAHDVERVVALYDCEAVLWGTRSPTLRDTPWALPSLTSEREGPGGASSPTLAEATHQVVLVP
jgi:hypothetical protein